MLSSTNISRVFAPETNPEERYIKNLEELNNEILKPFTHDLKNYVDLTEFRQNIESLITLHRTIHKNLSEGRSICDVFLGEIAFLKMYKDFIHTYEKIDESLRDVGTQKSFKRIFGSSKNERLRTRPVDYFQIQGIEVI